MKTGVTTRIFWIACGLILTTSTLLYGGTKLEGYFTEEEVRTFDPLGGPDKIIIRKSWYAGDRMVKDENWAGKTIARFDLGVIYQLDPFQKTYIALPADLLKQKARDIFGVYGLKNKKGELYFPDDLFVRTETTKEIGPWHCYQVMTNPKYRTPRGSYGVFWYSTDVDFPADIYSEKLKQLFGDAPEVDAFFDRLKKFEGYPVRTEAHGSMNTFTTLIKVEHQDDIDPGIFEIPEGYKQVPLPEDDSGLSGGR